MSDTSENVLGTHGTHLVMIQGLNHHWKAFVRNADFWYITFPKVGRIVQLPNGLRYSVVRIGKEYHIRDKYQVDAVYLKEWVE